MIPRVINNIPKLVEIGEVITEIWRGAMKREVLFLAWGIRVCYNVRNAESLYNEARLISYAIYNIAIVNIMMIAF
ncbi:hypothetical protein NQ317_006584, partial [Molorchus minor]